MGKHFLWDPVEDNIIEEFDDAGNTIADYTTEPYLYGDLVSQHRDGQSSFYHYDGQGNTTCLTDTVGNVSATYSYSAFGEVVSHTGDINSPFQFIGAKGYYKTLATNSVTIRHRDYLPHLGLWVSVDPLVPLHMSFNNPPYSYTTNRPLNYIDPSGLASATCEIYQPATFSEDEKIVLKQLISGPLGTLESICDLLRASANVGQTRRYHSRIKGILKNNPLPTSWDAFLGLCNVNTISNCPGCDTGACYRFLNIIIANMTYSYDRVSSLRGSGLSIIANGMIPGVEGDFYDYCHMWAFTFGNRVGFNPVNDKSSCLVLASEMFAFTMPPATWTSHSFHVLQNRCSRRCVIIDNLGIPRDPCDEKFPPGAEALNWLTAESLQKWNMVLRKCSCPNASTIPGE